MNQAGPVAIAMAGLWIAYLVPHHLRYRQQLLDSRADDRFSGRLRVLRVAEATAVAPSVTAAAVRLHPSRPVAAVPPSAGLGTRPAHATDEGPAGRGGRAMQRPHATKDRVAADLIRRSAAEHAQRAAHLARRAAAARRRAVLTVVLIVAVIGGWATVAISHLAGTGVLPGVVPSVLLVGVLGLGRRAVVAAARADAAWQAGAGDRLPAPHRIPSAVGRAVRPSDAVTEVMARVPRSAALRTEAAPAHGGAATVTAAPGTASLVAAAHADAVPELPAVTARSLADVDSGPAWAPIPVPRPAYTLKAQARRPEPAPLATEDLARAASTAAATGAASEAAEAPAAGPSTGAAPTTGGLDLDAVLARRRAAGE